MTARSAVLPSLGSDHWNAEVYGSLSVAAQIAAMVKSRSQTIALAYKLHSLARSLGNFLEEVHGQIEGKRPIAKPTEELTPERVQKAVDTLTELSTAVYDLYETGRQKRLTNNSLLAGSLARLRVYSEEVLDLVDWIEIVCGDRDKIDQAFQRSQVEKERGEIYDLSQVE